MSRYGFEYGELDDGRLWLRNPSGDYVGVASELLPVLERVAHGQDDIDGLQADLRDAVARLRDDGYLQPDAEIVATRHEDIVLWPRATLFLAMLAALALIVALRFDVAWPPPDDPMANLWAIPFFACAALLHELGHWSAARRWFDARIGFGLLNGIFPALVTKTNDAWACPRNVRIWINLAGPMVDLALSLVIAVVSLVWFPRVDILATLLLVQFMRIVFVFNPLIEGDGYWCLSDLLGVVNLRTRGLRDLRSLRPTPWAGYALVSIVFTIFAVSMYVWVFMGFLGLRP